MLIYRGASITTTLFFLIATLLFFAGMPNRLDATEANKTQHWHLLYLDDQVVGSLYEATWQDGSSWQTIEQTEMVINRLGSALKFHNSQKTWEDTSGQLVKVQVEMSVPGQTVYTEAYAEGEYWISVQSSGKERISQQQQRPATLLGTLGVRRLLASLQHIGDEISYHSFIPALGEIGEISVVLAGYEAFSGHEYRLVIERAAGVPVPLSRVIDHEGHTVISRMPGPFGEMQTMLADQTAASLASSGAELSPEVYEATLLQTGVRLPAPRRIDYLELQLTHRNPSLGWPEFTSDNQQVLQQSSEHLLLAIQRQQPQVSQPLHYQHHERLAPYLSANAWVNADQPELRALVKQIIANETDSWRAAKLLERWVAENLSFDLGIVMASSSEVLRQRRGTCTGYAMLLTAMARAAGIPARYVMGYVYVHGIFGGHAWTEVKIGDNWLALDAAIPSNSAADAARFAFLWSSLAEGIGELNAGPAMQLYGQIEAKVIAWRQGEHEHRFADGAPKPTVVNNLFTDNIQGIAWQLPARWQLVDYQRTWPDDLTAAAQTHDGKRVELRRLNTQPWEQANLMLPNRIKARKGATELEQLQINGRAAWLANGTRGSALLFVDTAGGWLFESDSWDILKPAIAGFNIRE